MYIKMVKKRRRRKTQQKKGGKKHQKGGGDGVELFKDILQSGILEKTANYAYKKIGKKKMKNIAKGAASGLADAYTGVLIGTMESALGSKKKKKGKGLFKDVKALLFGRKELPPNVRKILKEVGNEEIAYIQVARNPLSTYTKLAMNVVSLGEFEKKSKNLGFDELYHLYMIVTLKNGKNVLVEKNDVINMEYKGVRKNAESKMVRVNKSLNLNTLMANTKKYMGSKFLPYNGKSNNCQDFLMAILKSNNLGNESIYKFTKQNTKQIFKGSDTFASIMTFVTDLGAKIDILKKGAGNRKKRIR